MSSISLRADGPEPPARLACRLAHPTLGAAAGYQAGAGGAGRDPVGPAPAPGPSPVPAGGPDGSMRIGDRERQAVADELRAHFTAGRLGIEEFSSRLEEVWAAATATDLWLALRQLPPVPDQPRPWDPPPAGWSGGRSHDRRRPRPGVANVLARAHLRTYLMVAAILVAVWLLTTPGGYFWPAWPLLFWGWFVFLQYRFTRRWEQRQARRA